MEHNHYSQAHSTKHQVPLPTKAAPPHYKSPSEIIEHASLPSYYTQDDLPEFEPNCLLAKNIASLHWRFEILSSWCRFRIIIIQRSKRRVYWYRMEHRFRIREFLERNNE